MEEKDIKMPNHVAIIMDGNGRWAKKHGKERLYGHQKGVQSVRNAIEVCIETGVKWLTLYAFSTENWNRPKDEVNGLMSLFCESIANECEELLKEGVRLRIMGRVENLPDDVRENIALIENMTANNRTLNVTLALNYGGREEIVDAVKSIAVKIKNGEIEPSDIDNKMLSDNMYVEDMPDLDMLIRTSGEQRISNFMLWQISYSELFFTQTLWPDMTKESIKIAFGSYGNRDRRFGAI